MSSNELTYTTFPPGNPGQTKTPAELYCEMYPFADEGKDHIYASCALTSGGAIRFKDGSPDGEAAGHPWYQKLEVPDLIRVNGTFAALVIDLLVVSEQLDPNQVQVTLPHLIGSQFSEGSEGVRHWKEIEYLCLWFMTMAGMRPEVAADFYTQLVNFKRVDWQIFNDYTATRAKRKKQYKTLEAFVISFIKDLSPDLVNFLSSVIMLPDSHLSLGATLEQRIATGIGIPVQEVGINIFGSDNPLRQHPLWKDPVFRWLVFEDGVFRYPDHAEEAGSPIAKLYPVERKLEYGVPNPEAMTVLIALNEGKS